MTAIDFILKFKMDQKNYEFNRQEFLNEFSKNFLDRVKNCPSINPKTGIIYYSSFKQLVKEADDLFFHISQLSSKSLTKGLWNAFFVNVVVPYRKTYFPEIQKIIEKYRGENINPKQTRQDKKAK